MNQLEFTNVENLEKGHEHKETIYIISRFAAGLIGCIGAALCIPNYLTLRILGGALLVMDAVTFWLTRNWKIADMYDDCFILYHATDRSKAVRIDVDTISEWNTFEPQNNMGTLFITFTDGTTFSYNNYQMGGIKGYLYSEMRDKQTFQKKLNEYKSSDKKTASGFLNIFKRNK